MPGMNIEQLQPQRAKGGIRAAGQDRTLLHHLILRYWQLLDNSNKIEFSFKLFLKWSRRIKLFNWEISPFNQIHLTFPVLSTQFHKLQYNYPVLSSGLMISIENCLLGQVNWNGSRGRGRTEGVMVTYLKTTNEWAAERDLPKFNYSTDPLPSTDDEGLYCRCCWSSRRRITEGHCCYGTFSLRVTFRTHAPRSSSPSSFVRVYKVLIEIYSQPANATVITKWVWVP